MIIRLDNIDITNQVVGINNITISKSFTYTSAMYDIGVSITQLQLPLSWKDSVVLNAPVTITHDNTTYSYVISNITYNHEIITFDLDKSPQQYDMTRHDGTYILEHQISFKGRDNGFSSN